MRASGVCVGSQGGLTKTELTLGLTGLRNLFDDNALFSAYSVPRGKPHPDLFLHAAEVMGATPPETVVVEDSGSGVEAALAAGDAHVSVRRQWRPTAPGGRRDVPVDVRPAGADRPSG